MGMEMRVSHGTVQVMETGFHLRHGPRSAVLSETSFYPLLCCKDSEVRLRVIRLLQILPVMTPRINDSPRGVAVDNCSIVDGETIGDQNVRGERP